MLMRIVLGIVKCPRRSTEDGLLCIADMLPECGLSKTPHLVITWYRGVLSSMTRLQAQY